MKPLLMLSSVSLGAWEEVSVADAVYQVNEYSNLIRRHTPVVGPVSSLIVCLLLQHTLIRDFFRSLVEYSKVLLSIIRIRQSANWVSEDQRLAVKCRSKHSTRL